MKAGPQAEEFGAFLMANLRDSAIDQADALLSAHWKSPSLQTIQDDLAKLTPEQKAVVRRCLITSIDSGIHAFLFALSEAFDAGGRIAVVFDGQNVAEQSDGLHGELSTDEGWFKRFSKHGISPDPS